MPGKLEIVLGREASDGTERPRDVFTPMRLEQHSPVEYRFVAVAAAPPSQATIEVDGNINEIVPKASRDRRCGRIRVGIKDLGVPCQRGAEESLDRFLLLAAGGDIQLVGVPLKPSASRPKLFWRILIAVAVVGLVVDRLVRERESGRVKRRESHMRLVQERR